MSLDKEMPVSVNLLTIDEEPEIERTVTLYGEKYKLMSVEEFGLLAQKGLYQAAKTTQSFFDSANNADYGATKMKLDQFIHTVLPGLPEEIFKKLSEPKKQAIMTAFIQAVEEHGQYVRSKAANEEAANQGQNSNPDQEAPAPKAQG